MTQASLEMTLNKSLKCFKFAEDIAGENVMCTKIRESYLEYNALGLDNLTYHFNIWKFLFNAEGVANDSIIIYQKEVEMDTVFLNQTMCDVKE